MPKKVGVLQATMEEEGAPSQKLCKKWNLDNFREKILEKGEEGKKWEELTTFAWLVDKKGMDTT